MKVQTTKGLEPGVKALNNHALFEHCAGGMYAITEQYFDEAVEHLLIVHGVNKIEIIENDDNIKD